MNIIPRFPYVVLGSSLWLLGIIGHIFSISTLGVALVTSFVFLVATFLRRPQYSIYLVDMWILGFLYLYYSEYVILRSSVISEYGPILTFSAEGHVVASFGAVLFGYALFLRYLWGKIMKKDNDLRIPLSACHTNRERIPLEMIIGLLIMSLIAFVYIVKFVSLDQLFHVQRGKRLDNLGIDSYEQLLKGIVVMLPVVSIYLASRYHLSPFLKFFALFVSLLAIISTFAMGTRTYLLISGVGICFYFFNFSRRMYLRQLTILVLCGLILMVGQGINRMIRTISISDISLYSVIDTLSTEGPIDGEHLLKFNVWILQSEYYKRPWRSEMQSLQLVYWWFPRALWQDKPYRSAYWFVRDVSGGFSEGHSAGSGFSMDALLDFGPLWGAVFCIVFGVLLAACEALAVRYNNPYYPASMTVALLYPCIFLAVRSVYFSIFLVSAYSLTIVVLFLLLEKASNLRRAKTRIVSHAHPLLSRRPSGTYHSYRFPRPILNLHNRYPVSKNLGNQRTKG